MREDRKFNGNRETLPKSTEKHMLLLFRFPDTQFKGGGGGGGGRAYRSGCWRSSPANCKNCKNITYVLVPRRHFSIGHCAESQMHLRINVYDVNIYVHYVILRRKNGQGCVSL